MFKCSECGLEYEKKPEYCDCGNNEFVLTIDETAKTEPAATPENIISNETQQKFEPKLGIDNSLKYNVSPISVSIFILCLILSFIIVFVWKPAEKQVQTPTKKEIAATNIPSIDSIWKEVKVVEEKPAKAEVKPVEIIKPKQAINKTQPAKTTSVKKTTPVKQQGSTKQTSNATKPAQKPAVQTTAKQTSNPQQTNTVQEKQLSDAEKLAQVEAHAKALLKAQQDKQELASYKVELRNTIGRKIDFTRVIGDGDCIIAFGINANGKLINRTFEKQSSNMTLNDAVYKAVMSTPTFNPPPAGYKNETLRLTISFNNGNFSITLK